MTKQKMSDPRYDVFPDTSYSMDLVFVFTFANRDYRRTAVTKSKQYYNCTCNPVSYAYI